MIAAKTGGRKLRRVRTGITGLDEVLYGGIPAGGSMLVTGNPGAGKTILLNEFIYRGITEFGENGIIVAVEESPGQIISNTATFGWDYEKLISKKQLSFIDASPDYSQIDVSEVSDIYNLKPLMLRLRHAVEKTGAKRVVLDSIAALFGQFSNSNEVRVGLHILIEELRRLGVTGLFSTEKYSYSSDANRSRIQEYVVDGLIELQYSPGQQAAVRKLEIIKLRGCSFRSGQVEFEINENGLAVYPKIPLEFKSVGSRISKRLSSNIPGLDRLLGGGIPQGHMVLLNGNTGSGKSIFGMHFLSAALERNESVVYVNMEEPKEQVYRIARSHGINFSAPERAGRLTYLTFSLIDISPDKLLYSVVNAIENSGASCLVIDSISSIPSETYTEEETRQFILQLTRFLKMRGITSLFTFMMSRTLGAGSDNTLGYFEGNEMRLASLVDGIILLRYGESNGNIAKYISILKMRGIKHEKGIHAYEILKGKVNISTGVASTYGRGAVENKKV